ncbi:MAG: hypothetical protein M3Q45_07695, partial [Chloroflexota bacterium]|nr:hypothetical protein [Chloroflexota bacterium]
MKTFRENLPYILLVVIAIILVITTISLQASIISNQSAEAGGDDANNRGVIYLLRERLGQLILPATLTPAPTIAAATAMPTDTPPAVVV